MRVFDPRNSGRRLRPARSTPADCRAAVIGALGAIGAGIAWRALASTRGNRAHAALSRAGLVRAGGRLLPEMFIDEAGWAPVTRFQ